jgi:hypothetical protein
MSAIKVLEELRLVDPVCAGLAEEMNVIETAYAAGELSKDERNHLLTEIRDIRAAQEAAGNEIAVRHIVNAAQILLKLV